MRREREDGIDVMAVVITDVVLIIVIHYEEYSSSSSLRAQHALTRSGIWHDMASQNEIASNSQ